MNLALASVEEEIEAYLENNERSPAKYAHVLGISVDSFYKAVAVYKEKKMLDNGLESSSILVHADPLMRKPKKILTEPQKDLVYEAYLSGGSVGSIAERFDISDNYVFKIIKARRESGYTREQPVIAAPPVADTVISNDEMSVQFEGDFLIIKLHKKHVTRKLLAGVM